MRTCNEQKSNVILFKPVTEKAAAIAGTAALAPAAVPAQSGQRGAGPADFL